MSILSNIKILHQSLLQAEKVAMWLKKSLEKCKNIRLDKKKFSDEDFDRLENLASRFGRLSDILIQKIFRTIDAIELEQKSPIIDVINRSAKRNLVGDEAKMRRIRELRNQIVHEYSDEQLVELFLEIRDLSPILLADLEKTNRYCTRFS